ncbi:hypothetical protein [Microbacterium sp. OVT16B]|uniref:hypothetical protein n=1 Tax=Microbacterium sp. OVT16B TaxID=2862682 RepID=UPI001CBB28E1|nr:hypothetical protein [Microbacterium sp. OVT16B]
MTSAKASIDVITLRDSPEEGAETKLSADVDKDAFEQAAEVQDAKPIAALKSRRRRKPRASVILQPAEREAREATLKLRAREQDVGLKRLLAWVAIAAVILQLAVADAFLAYYMLWADEPPSDTVLIAWLSASVVEVIGIVAIVARNLFPNRTKRFRKAPKRKK